MVSGEGLWTVQCVSYFLMAFCSFDLCEVLGKCSDVKNWNSYL